MVKVWRSAADQVAAALTSHGLAAWQIPRGAQSGRQMTKVMKDFCASQESKETANKDKSKE